METRYSSSMSAKKKPIISPARTAPFAPSCIITLDKNGFLQVQVLNQSADPTLALRDELRKTKGCHGRYTHALPIIRGKSTRQLHFA